MILELAMKLTFALALALALALSRFCSTLLRSGCRSLSGSGRGGILAARGISLEQTADKQQFISQLIAQVILPIRGNFC